MASAGPSLDLTGDVVALARALVDIPSESHQESAIAEAVQAALQVVPQLEVVRHRNTVVARTHFDHAERVLIGGHLDTVPSAGNLPARLADGQLWGLGSCDMKGGVAVALALAAASGDATRDVTFVFYDCEEVAAEFNGLQYVADHDPDLIDADFAVLMEPSNAGIEAGCQGTMRAEVHLVGRRAHSARAWMGANAVHAAGAILTALREYQPRQPVIDGLEYREGMSAVGIHGGVAGNVIPDDCVVTVNYRFAPDRTVADAEAHLRAVLGAVDVSVADVQVSGITIVDAAAAAKPGLDRPAAADFVRAMGVIPRPKYGWTDVARFAALGIPAVNFGPGDPALAHAADERVPVEQIRSVYQRMYAWLTAR